MFVVSICMCVYAWCPWMCVCNVYVGACMYVYMYVCVYEWMSMWVCISMYVYVCTNVHVCARIRMCVHESVCMCAWVYTYVCACTSAYVCECVSEDECRLVCMCVRAIAEWCIGHVLASGPDTLGSITPYLEVHFLFCFPLVLQHPYQSIQLWLYTWHLWGEW